jgi:hypothetical protein
MKLLHTMLSLTLFAAAAPAGAARTAALLNYEDLPVESATGKPLDVEQIRKAIITGAATRQWAASVKPGNVVQLTYNRGKYTGVVAVKYSTKTYSIKYVDSTNLNYGMEGGKAVIHPTYNGWINNLRQAIDVQLRTM